MRGRDRNIVGFFPLVAGVVVVSLLGAVSLSGKATSVASHPGEDAAGKAGLQQAMAELQEVTDEYFDHPRSAKIVAFIKKGHAQVRELASLAPEERRIAAVIFRRALSSQELDGMTREFHLSVHEAKLVFAGSARQEFSNTIPMQFFWRNGDPLVVLVDGFIAANRSAFAQRALQIGDSPHPEAKKAVEQLTKLAKETGPVLVRVGVTAKSDMLRLVSEERDVYAVVMDPSAERVRLLDEMRSRMSGATSIQDVTDR